MEQELYNLGLGEYESKIYLALLKYGHLTGSDLARASKVPQSKIYEIASCLEKKGFVSVLNLKPRQFRAVEPEKAISTFINSKKENLEKAGEDLMKNLKEIKRTRIERPKTDELIHIYRGREIWISIIANRYHTAKKYIKEMLSFEYIPHSLFREIEKTSKRGIQIRLIATKIGRHQMKLIEEVKNCGAKVRYYPIGDLRIAVKDGTEAAQIIVNSKNLTDRTTIVADSLALTKALEYYFDYIWEKAEKL